MEETPMKAGLPNWLWPAEDEEAVLKAERLIEETHQTLKKMENDIRHDDIKNGIPLKTKRLKYSVVNKLNYLEEGLKIVTSPNEHHQSGSPDQCCTHQQSLPTGCASSKPSGNSEENVLLVAHEKLGDALEVARSVSASLNHHIPHSSTFPKLGPLKASNVGIFEVRSNEVGKEQPVKSRLVKSQVSAISIKRNLELQSIPPVYLPPSEKYIPQNVVVCHAEYQRDDPIEEPLYHKHSKSKIRSKSAKVERYTSDKQENFETNDDGMHISQLSRQLAQVEELRELNQSQVNHVLRFLISKVTALSHSQTSLKQPHELPKSHTSEDISKQNVNFSEPETSQSTSSSDGKRPKIAYDSLSRFLETYRQAAQHAVVAKKKRNLQQKKDVSKVNKAVKFRGSPNHLLIGPLRPSTRPIEIQRKENTIEPKEQLCDSDMPNSLNISSEDLQVNNYLDFVRSDQDKTDINDSPLKTSKNSLNSTLESLDNLLSKASGDDYEDDWEEVVFEDSANVHADGTSLNTILEVEEQSSTHPQEPNLALTNPPELRTSPTLSPPISQELTPANAEPLKFPLVPSREPVPSTNFTSSVKVNSEPSVLQYQFAMPQAVTEENRTSEDNSLPNICEIQHSAVLANEQKKVQVSGQMSRVRQYSSSSSSSGSGHRKTTYNVRQGKDLKLRDDLQLKSAILLNWQLEDRLQQKLNELGPHLEQKQFSNQPHQGTLTRNVEEQWKRALQELDKRIRAMESNENITQMFQKLNVQTREGQTQTSPISKQFLSHELKHCGSITPGFKELQPTSGEIATSADNLQPLVLDNECTTTVGTRRKIYFSGEKLQFYNTNTPVQSELQRVDPLNHSTQKEMVQASCKEILTQLKPQVENCSMSAFQDKIGHLQSSDFDKDQLNKIVKAAHDGLSPYRSDIPLNYPKELSRQTLDKDRACNVPLRLWHANDRDLTEDLLIYTRMGVFTKNTANENLHSPPMSSSTTSSLQPSNFQTSLSDGEMLTNGSVSCGCSEGEVCLCQSDKGVSLPFNKTHALAPVDTQRDVSQGEIPSSGEGILLKDSSQGEILVGSFTGASSPVTGMSLASSNSEVE